MQQNCSQRDGCAGSATRRPPGGGLVCPRSGVAVFQDSALAAEGPEAEERVGAEEAIATTY